MTRRSLRQTLGAMKVVATMRLQGVAFPPVVPDTGRSGVFIGTTNSAGQGWAWARALERAEPSLRVVNVHDIADSDGGGFQFAADQRVNPRFAAHSLKWQQKQRAVLENYRAVLIESGSPLFARMLDGDAGAHAEVLLHAGVNVALLFHGSDIRDPDLHIPEEPQSHFTADPEFARIFREVTSRNRALVKRLGVPVFVSTPDLLREIDGAIWLPVAVDAQQWAQSDPPLSHNGPLRVAHVPSNSMVKGTELVEPMLKQLTAAGTVRYQPVQGIAHAEMPSAYGHADVVLDQFRVGIYGVAACEAMAAGRIVVSHVSERVREATRQLTGEDLPIIETTAETLEDVLTDIITNPDPYLEIAARGPGFVQRHHDGRRSGQVLSEWIQTTNE